MTAELYASARRVFWVVNGGPSHKNWAAVARPFDWRFNRTDLNQFPARVKQHDRHAPR